MNKNNKSLKNEKKRDLLVVTTNYEAFALKINLRMK